MAEAGRSIKVPDSTVRQLLQLYCAREDAEKFLYSIDECAHLCDLDPKTARRLLRETTVSLIEGHLKGQTAQE